VDADDLKRTIEIARYNCTKSASADWGTLPAPDADFTPNQPAQAGFSLL
jgi:hypothetical protein